MAVVQSRPQTAVVFGTFDEPNHPRITVIAEGLAARGWDVRRHNAPWAAGTADRIAMLRRPWLALPMLWRLAQAWWRLVTDDARRDGADVVVVAYFGYLDVHLARLLYPDAVVVLDDLAPLTGTTEDRGLAQGWQHGILATIEELALDRCDVVAVDTPEHLRPDRACVVVPVGAPDHWFVDRGPSPTEGPLRVVFFGLFTPLQGTTTIAEAVRRLGGRVHVTLVGHGQEHERVLATLATTPHVEVVPWVDAVDLPGLVAGHDACLGIFGTTPKAHRVVPNKVFQGMAAGCAVVTADTPPQRRVLGDAATFVPPGDADALAAVLAAWADDRAGLQHDRARSRHHAEQHFRGTTVVSALDDDLRRRTG